MSVKELPSPVENLCTHHLSQYFWAFELCPKSEKKIQNKDLSLFGTASRQTNGKTPKINQEKGRCIFYIDITIKGNFREFLEIVFWTFQLLNKNLRVQKMQNMEFKRKVLDVHNFIENRWGKTKLFESTDCIALCFCLIPKQVTFLYFNTFRSFETTNFVVQR